MTRRFSEGYVRQLRREAANYRTKLRTFNGEREQLVRLSAENMRLRDKLTEAERDARFYRLRVDELKTELQHHQSTITALHAAPTKGNTDD